MTFQMNGRMAAAAKTGIAVWVAVAALGAVSQQSARAAAAAAPAPPAAAAAPAFGSVDMPKCAQESKSRAESEQVWRDYAQSLDKALQKLATGSSRLLPEADIKTLAGLYEKGPTLSPTEQKQQSDLEAKADAAGAELARIQQNASPSDADKKRLDELNGIQQNGGKILQGISDDYRDRVQQKRDELLQKLTVQIREAVAKVAKEKGLAVVFDSQVAVYTQNDITQDVIKVLNK